jgi:hypothetical protein
MRYLSLLLVVLHILFTLFGCGYAIQTRSNLPFETLSIGKIENKTVEPKLEDMFNRLLSEIFYEYGFNLNPNSQYLLEGEIISFNLEPLVEKNLSAAQYRVIIKANFSIRNKITNEVFPIKVEGPFITFFKSAEGLNIVLAQKELATEKAIKDISQEIARIIVYKGLNNK